MAKRGLAARYVCMHVRIHVPMYVYVYVRIYTDRFVQCVCCLNFCNTHTICHGHGHKLYTTCNTSCGGFHLGC